MVNLDPFIKRLTRDISSLPEARMKASLLGQRLSLLSPGEAACALDSLYNEASAHLPEFMITKMVLVDSAVVMEALGEEKKRLIYLASLEMGLKRVSRLLTDLPPYKRGIGGYDKEEEGQMEFITLGERRAMARGWIKDRLDRLLSDPDPTVVSHLLNNPRITEKEVAKIASKRPNSQEILRLLATHRRWGSRYNVKKALVQNPYTPPRVSLGLLEFLFSQDLREIAEDGSLHPQVRVAAREALDKRG
ncbi:MAG: hypothetical protein HY878_01890 [Deltaproteobacteria bacterium]|nr:hypothetical protein [Deltaproteobacteria bacterium]